MLFHEFFKIFLSEKYSVSQIPIHVVYVGVRYRNINRKTLRKLTKFKTVISLHQRKTKLISNYDDFWPHKYFKLRYKNVNSWYNERKTIVLCTSIRRFKTLL